MFPTTTTILGTGSYLPRTCLTSDEIDTRMGWPSGQSLSRFGLHARHVASDDETSSYMAVMAAERALEYMGLRPGQRLSDIEIDTVFIGSCTNGRIEDLREVAKVMAGRKVKDGLRAMIVPGSGLVRAMAEEEGIAQQLIDAGFEWRMAGCSMCLGMNPDQLSAGERCASTSNRNFEGRQGYRGRTHLMSPAMAAAAAVTGRLTDVRELV